MTLLFIFLISVNHLNALANCSKSVEAFFYVLQHFAAEVGWGGLHKARHAWLSLLAMLITPNFSKYALPVLANMDDATEQQNGQRFCLHWPTRMLHDTCAQFEGWALGHAESTQRQSRRMLECGKETPASQTCWQSQQTLWWQHWQWHYGNSAINLLKKTGKGLNKLWADRRKGKLRCCMKFGISKGLACACWVFLRNHSFYWIFSFEQLAG